MIRTPATPAAAAAPDLAQLVARLRQHVAAELRAGVRADACVARCIGRLRALEARDGRFHRLGLVRAVRARVATAVGRALDAALDRLTQRFAPAGPGGGGGGAGGGGGDNASAGGLGCDFDAAVREIVEGEEYTTLRAGLVDEVRAAVQELQRRMEQAKGATAAAGGRRRPQEPRRRQGSMNDDHNDVGAEVDPWDRLLQCASEAAAASSQLESAAAVAAVTAAAVDAVATTTSSSSSSSFAEGDGACGGGIDFVVTGSGTNNHGTGNDDDDIDRFSQFSFNTLPPYEKIPSICCDMALSNTDTVRRSAVDAISEFPAGDLLHSEFWPDLRTAVIAALADPIPDIRSAYLGLLWRLYRDAAPVQTGEVYLCLLTHLTGLANQAEGDRGDQGGLAGLAVPLSSLVPGASRADDSVLQQVRILNLWQRDLPRHQVYFPDSLVAQICVGTFNLLQHASPPAGRVGFRGILALCDPGATWFERWFARSRPRDQVRRKLPLSSSRLPRTSLAGMYLFFSPTRNISLRIA